MTPTVKHEAPASGRESDETRHFDAFVSYSHHDRAGALRLATVLEGRGIDVWIDESDIPSGSRWREELERAIEVSGAFLFLLSAGSAASEQCRRELDYAVALNKRVLPVRLGEIAGAEVPPALSQYQFIPSRGVFDAGDDAAVTGLVEAIETDREWVREHTDWGVKASEWDRRGRDSSFLLSGTELGFAEAWRSGAAGKQPGVSTLQSEYIDASRQAATRRLRRTRGFVTGALVVAIALALLAFIQREQAVSAQHAATSGELSAQSVLALASDPQLSLLLAVRAADVQRTAAALDALRRALPANHLLRSLSPPGERDPRPLNSAEWSPDGSRVLTASLDGHAYLYDAATGRVIRTFPLSTYYTQGAMFDGDGQKVLTWTESGAQVWDLDGTSAPVRLPDNSSEPIENAVISPNGDFVAINDHIVSDSLWDARSGRLLHTLEHSPNVDGALAFSPDSSLVAVGNTGGTASVFDTSTASLVRTLVAGPVGPDVVFSPNGRRLATVVGDPSIDTANSFEQTQVWNVANWSELAHVNGAAAGFSPGSGYVVTTSSDGTARVWRADTGILISQLKSTSPVTTQAQFAPDVDGDISHIVTGTASGFATVWNAVAGTPVATLVGDSGSVTPAGFSPDGNRVLTWSGDGYARIWGDGVIAPQSSTEPSALGQAEANGSAMGDFDRLATDPLTPVRAFELNDTTTLPQALGRPGSLIVVDVHSGAILARLPASPGVSFNSDAFDASGRVMLVTSDKAVSGHLSPLPAQLRLVRGGRLLRTLSGPASLAAGGTISPDGRLGATIDATNEIAIWDVASGRELAVFRGHVGRRDPYGQAGLIVKFSPDGSLVLSSDDSGLTFIWDARTGQIRDRIQGTPVPPGQYSGWGGAISPDDRYAVTVASWDPIGHVYRVGDSREIAQLHGGAELQGGIDDATFSPDSTLIAGLAGDAIRVWDLQHADPILTLPGQFGDRIEFSGDGEALVTDGQASAGSAPYETFSCAVCGGFGRLLTLAAQNETRQLTAEERALYLGG